MSRHWAFNTAEMRTVLKDTLSYHLQVIGLTETHVTDKLSFSGIHGYSNFSGTGIAIKRTLSPHFKHIPDRISTASFKVNDKHKGHVIVAYAPTRSWSLKEPQIHEGFYNELERVTSNYAKNKHLLLILGNFKALVTKCT